MVLKHSCKKQWKKIDCTLLTLVTGLFPNLASHAVFSNTIDLLDWFATCSAAVAVAVVVDAVDKEYCTFLLFNFWYLLGIFQKIFYVQRIPILFDFSTFSARVTSAKFWYWYWYWFWYWYWYLRVHGIRGSETFLRNPCPISWSISYIRGSIS